MRSKLHDMAAMKWLQTRCSQKAKDNYLTLPQIIEYRQELGKLFKKFDGNGQGEISKQELQELFNKYGISITMKEINSYVRIVNQKSGPNLTEDEFKLCATNENAKSFFRRVVRKSNERNPDTTYPTDITMVLNQFHYLNQRKQLVNKINDSETLLKDRITPLRQLVTLSSQVDIAPRYPRKLNRIERTKSTAANYMSINTSNYNSVSTCTSTTNSRFSRRQKCMFVTEC